MVNTYTDIPIGNIENTVLHKSLSLKQVYMYIAIFFPNFISNIQVIFVFIHNSST